SRTRDRDRRLPRPRHRAQGPALRRGLLRIGTTKRPSARTSFGRAGCAQNFRRAAVHVDRILKGAKPADMPIEQPTVFELAANLKVAWAIGLTIPPSVLAQATEVIQ
ncbi:MAG: ABC transporter substrate binding protein, partial [Chloroflexota bacterium]